MSQPEVTSEDPAVRDSRREAMIVLIFSACALAYSVTTSYILGYSAGGRELRFVNLGAGIACPDWVFWGIIVPWFVCFVFGALFAFFWMTDSELGEELEEDDGFLTVNPGDSGMDPTKGGKHG